MKRYMILTAVIASLLLTACSGKTADADSTAKSEISLEEGQSLLIGQVTAINGNEVVLALAEETDMQENGRGEMPSFAEGKMPSFAEGEMPSFAEGEMPSFGVGEAPGGDVQNGSGGGQGFRGGMQEADGQDRSLYQLTGEEKTLLIPVGTAVTTPLGTQTTFTSIAVDDMLKLVVEEDGDGGETVTAVWIVE
jgi:hypothetical protein